MEFSSCWINSKNRSKISLRTMGSSPLVASSQNQKLGMMRQRRSDHKLQCACRGNIHSTFGQEKMENRSKKLSIEGGIPLPIDIFQNGLHLLCIHALIEKAVFPYNADLLFQLAPSTGRDHGQIKQANLALIRLYDIQKHFQRGGFPGSAFADQPHDAAAGSEKLTSCRKNRDRTYKDAKPQCYSSKTSS